MAYVAPDFESHFHSEKFSDVDIEIVEETLGPGHKRKWESTIPGHSMVLMAFSNYCKVKVTAVGGPIYMPQLLIGIMFVVAHCDQQ